MIVTIKPYARDLKPGMPEIIDFDGVKLAFQTVAGDRWYWKVPKGLEPLAKKYVKAFAHLRNAPTIVSDDEGEEEILGGAQRALLESKPVQTSLGEWYMRVNYEQVIYGMRVLMQRFQNDGTLLKFAKETAGAFTDFLSDSGKRLLLVDLDEPEAPKDEPKAEVKNEPEPARPDDHVPSPVISDEPKEDAKREPEEDPLALYAKGDRSALARAVNALKDPKLKKHEAMKRAVQAVNAPLPSDAQLIALLARAGRAQE